MRVWSWSKSQYRFTIAIKFKTRSSEAQRGALNLSLISSTPWTNSKVGSQPLKNTINLQISAASIWMTRTLERSLFEQEEVKKREQIVLLALSRVELFAVDMHVTPVTKEWQGYSGLCFLSSLPPKTDDLTVRFEKWSSDAWPTVVKPFNWRTTNQSIGSVSIFLHTSLEAVCLFQWWPCNWLFFLTGEVLCVNQFPRWVLNWTEPPLQKTLKSLRRAL